MKAGKLGFGLIVVIVVVAIIVVATPLLSTSKVHPANAFPKLSANTFEGFDSKVNYSSYPSGKDIDAENQHLIQSAAADKSAQPVKGYVGSLYGPPGEQEKITTFLDAKGSLSSQCAATSSGLTNSLGYLCLDQKQLNLLTTRGQNQTYGTCAN